MLRTNPLFTHIARHFHSYKLPNTKPSLLGRDPYHQWPADRPRLPPFALAPGRLFGFPGQPVDGRKQVCGWHISEDRLGVQSPGADEGLPPEPRFQPSLLLPGFVSLAQCLSLSELPCLLQQWQLYLILLFLWGPWEKPPALLPSHIPVCRRWTRWGPAAFHAFG